MRIPDANRDWPLPSWKDHGFIWGSSSDDQCGAFLSVTYSQRQLSNWEFERFGHLSNFKVNYSKAEALNITYDDALVKHLTELFTFKWQDSSIKYLGTHIPKNIYKLNFLPILNLHLTDLGNYGTRHLSWFGCINVIKMDVLPRCLYLFQTVPINLPSSFFKQLSRAINKFIWGSLCPHNNMSILCNPKSTGGAGLPDFKKYPTAAFLDNGSS